MIKEGFTPYLLIESHQDCYFAIDFSKPSIVKAIYIDPQVLLSSGIVNLHFYGASVLHPSIPLFIAELDVTDYNPEPGEYEPFEVLNKFDLHEIALSDSTYFTIDFEAGGKIYPYNIRVFYVVVYESTPDSVCTVHFKKTSEPA